MGSIFNAQKTDSAKVEPRLLSLQEAAEYLNVSYWHIRELIDRGTLRRVKLGRRVLVDIGDLNKLIEASKR